MEASASPPNAPALEPVDNGIWIAEGGIVSFYGFPYPTRSVIADLGGGELWVWSPVALSPELREAVGRIGRPCHLVSPNKLHHLFLGAWHEAWPEARLWGPASTIAKCPELPFAAALQDEPPAEWNGLIDQAWFRGSFAMDEIVFLHRPSRTVIIADLSENFSEAFLERHWPAWARWIARLSGIVIGKGYAPIDYRLTFLDRRPLREARDRMVSWHPERVIMAHGEWQRGNGTAYLQRAFAWVG